MCKVKIIYNFCAFYRTYVEMGSILLIMISYYALNGVIAFEDRLWNVDVHIVNHRAKYMGEKHVEKKSDLSFKPNYINTCFKDK